MNYHKVQALMRALLFLPSPEVEWRELPAGFKVFLAFSEGRPLARI